MISVQDSVSLDLARRRPHYRLTCKTVVSQATECDTHVPGGNVYHIGSNRTIHRSACKMICPEKPRHDWYLITRAWRTLAKTWVLVADGRQWWRVSICLNLGLGQSDSGGSRAGKLPWFQQWRAKSHRYTTCKIIPGIPFSTVI